MKWSSVSAVMLAVLLGTVFFSGISIVNGQTDTHDLRVALEAGPSLGGHHLTLGHSRTLYANVTNDGNVTEPEVTLLLLINGSEAVHSTIANLSSGASFRISYDWNPLESNVYNVTAYAPPVAGETDQLNNVAQWLVNVCSDMAPDVSFTYSPQVPGPVAGENVTFDASASFDPDWGNIITYSWNFNGTNITSTNPLYSYPFTDYGNATVSLTLYDTEDENSSLLKPLRVCARPVGSFTPPPPDQRYVGYQLTFDATSSYDPDNDTGPTRGIANYTWNFGDGPPIPGQNITNHTYNASGPYRVYLTVTDFDNLTRSTFKDITIGPGVPMANFTITSPHPPTSPYHVNENLTFDASNSTPDGGSIVSWIWDWNDTTTDTTGAAVINHTFAQPKTYSVRLIVNDTDGKASLPAVRSIVVNLPVSLGVTNYTGGTTVTANPAQTFNISIVVTNVEALDYFEFTLNYPEGSPPVLLTGEKIYDGSFVLDEKMISDLQGQVRVNSTAHLGGARGNFTLAIVNFGVTNPGGCTLNLSRVKLLDINGTVINVGVTQADFFTTKPVAYFSADTHSPSTNYNVTFNASESHDPDSPTNGTNHGIVEYMWDFGDNVTDVASGPVTYHEYINSGTYYVNLNVIDDDGESWWYNDTTPMAVNATHDVAVIRVSLDPVECCDAGYTSVFNISIVLRNKGNVNETFDVATTYNGSYVINITAVTLSPFGQTQLMFDWNVTGLQKGKYTISANATLLGDFNVSDNTASHIQLVGLIGNCNYYPDSEYTVDIYDAILLANFYGAKEGDSNWNGARVANFSPVPTDDKQMIDVYDAILLSNHYGEYDP